MQRVEEADKKSSMNDNPIEQKKPITPKTQRPPPSHEFCVAMDTAPVENETAQLPSSPTQHNTKMEKEKISPLPRQLYNAALKGDWKSAKKIFDEYPFAITKEITCQGQTTLLVAAMYHQFSFVEKLVKLTSGSDLAAKTESGVPILSIVATSRAVRIAKLIVDKNPNLPNIVDKENQPPVQLAVAFKRKHMASFLFSKTNFEALDTLQQFRLLISTIVCDYYDIALDIMGKKPELATLRFEETDDTALHVLARKSSAIGSSSELSFWKKQINSRFKGFYDKALMQTFAHQLVGRLWDCATSQLLTEKIDISRVPLRLMDEAAKVGNVEFLLILLRRCPELISALDMTSSYSFFHTAVENRQESVFSLIYEIGGVKDLIVNSYDDKKNINILHLAGKLAAPSQLNKVSGAALQMQRELLWFKEVEKIVLPVHLGMKCAAIPELSTGETKSNPPDQLTPRELFSRQHKQLLKDGEEWMKHTANSCMLVATLITTVVFAAAFTVPGGNNDKEGTPIFQQNKAFTVFVISDVAALVLSTTSILTFLSILTSRYAEDDFLISLPRKLLFGLLTLFVSIVCMAMAFSTTFFIAYDKTKAKIPLGIAAVTILPIGCFCVFHYKLAVDILRSSYWSYFSLKKRMKRLF
ncbi:ankyrin repeat-containing protein At5g02620-like [Benincasa hispida]|uniref:ankyrin repeat-containing protein At5g02620-like n=1 Tax=Benincasa hispida TaxID=102211 RepID=UPI0019008976|nr:ankyrin repeat-containing protein At5g02620-like [Benincasa hispida]